MSALLSVMMALSLIGFARAQSGELTAAALGNATYPVADAPGGKVALKDGKFDDPSQHYSAGLGAAQDFADANHDGQRDAAVDLTLSTSSGNVFSYLAVVLNDKGAAKPVDSVFLGDRIQVLDVVFGRGAEIEVSLLERRFDQPMTAQPTIPVQRHFRLNAQNKLIASGPLSNADVNYASYPISGVKDGRATFAAGRYEDAPAKIAAQLLRAPRAVGDIDGDGSPDMAVPMVISSGGASAVVYVCVVLNKGYQPLVPNCEVIDDRIRVTNIAIRNGRVLVSYLGRRDGQPASARPTVRRSKSFTLPVPAPGTPLSDQGGASAASTIVGYTCAGNKAISVTYDANQATLSYDSQVFTLPQVESASGIRYSDGKIEWRSKGKDGDVYDPVAKQVILPDCKAIEPATPLATATAIITPTAAATSTGTSVAAAAATPTLAILPTLPVTPTATPAPTASVIAPATATAMPIPTATPPPPAFSGVLTGTVTYLQRIALVPGAEINVSLNSVPADAPAKRVVSQTIQASGKQVPIPFELTYDPASIDPHMTYAVEVRIMINGQLRWTNTTRTNVLTNDAPATDVEIVVDPVK